MPPRGDVIGGAGPLHFDDVPDLLPDAIVRAPSSPESATAADEQPLPPLKIVWRNVAIFSTLHAASLYALTLLPSLHWSTYVFTYAYYVMSGLGITAGAHRLWSHRSYKARWPLRLLLMIFNCMACQNDVIEWSRDHRVHHKYSETNADPHNAKRGFFFSHIGWLLSRKQEDVKIKGKNIDLSDLFADPILRFQRRFFVPLTTFWCFVVPSVVPWLVWSESLWNAYFVCALLRYCVLLNCTWLVNSLAHWWGTKPYDANINPVENVLVVVGAIGEGFHNYHHTFPHDYATSEYGWRLNVTTWFINTAAKLGLAYDRRVIPREVVLARKLRTGDGTGLSAADMASRSFKKAD